MKKIALEDLPITDGRIVWKLQPVKVRGLTPEPLFTLPSNVLSPPIIEE